MNFSIDSTLAAISSKYPEFHAEFLTLPEAQGIPAYFYGHTNGVSYFFANYYDEIATDGKSISANFLADKSAAGKFELMMYPVHAGVYGSWLVKFIYCIGGLAPAILSITGFFLWLRRSKRLSSSHSPRSTVH